MRRMNGVVIERDYPWLVRYTEDIFRDAPSQCGVYYKLMDKYMDKEYKLKRSEVVRAHQEWTPYHPYLVIDIAPEDSKDDCTVDGMYQWDNRTLKSSSTGRTTNSSRGGGSPPQDPNKKVTASKDVPKTPEYFNPVLSGTKSSKPFVDSGFSLSFGSFNSPLKISDIQDDLPEEEKALMRKLKALQEKRGVTTSSAPKTFASAVETGATMRLKVPIWSPTQEKPTSVYQGQHASGNFMMLSAKEEADRMKGGLISVTTRQLDVSQVTYASVQNLEKFKRELDTARLEGHTHVTRQTYLSENARDTIDDAVERAHEEQAFNAFQKGEPFPQYVKYE